MTKVKARVQVDPLVQSAEALILKGKDQGYLSPDDVIARAQFVLALKGGGLEPEQLVVGYLGNRSHRPSLRATIAPPPPGWRAGPGSPSLSAQKAHKWRIAASRLLENVITLRFDQRNYWTKLSEYARIG